MVLTRQHIMPYSMCNYAWVTYSIMPVPSNATQRMYNIQFNLLISQHVSPVSQSSSGEYSCLPNALLNCKPSYCLYGPIFTIIVLVADNIGIHQYYILNYYIVEY
jgi:hypothetical protein